jgi:hypothetical protein
MEQRDVLALDPSQPENPLDYNTAKEIGDILNRHYPGHLWAVHVKSGLVQIRDLMLSGKWGFVLMLPSIYSASDLSRQVVNAGGELLERYKQRRGRMNSEAILEQPVDVAGNMIPEL